MPEDIDLRFHFIDRSGREVFHMVNPFGEVIGEIRLLRGADCIHDEVWVSYRKEPEQD